MSPLYGPTSRELVERRTALREEFLDALDEYLAARDAINQFLAEWPEWRRTPRSRLEDALARMLGHEDGG